MDCQHQPSHNYAILHVTPLQNHPSNKHRQLSMMFPSQTKPGSTSRLQVSSSPLHYTSGNVNIMLKMMDMFICVSLRMFRNPCICQRLLSDGTKSLLRQVSVWNNALRSHVFCIRKHCLCMCIETLIISMHGLCYLLINHNDVNFRTMRLDTHVPKLRVGPNLKLVFVLYNMCNIFDHMG